METKDNDTSKTDTGSESAVERLVMCFNEGVPSKDGWYLVKLIPGHVRGGQRYDVDYCRDNGRSDGGGRGWAKWYVHNISHYAALDT
jgi:hypothetical protein